MDKRKIVIVGASHGGHESAIELLDKYNDVDVTVYEAGDFISFMSCGMQLYLENKVTAEDDVRNFAPEDVEKKGGHVYANHEVTAIHPENYQQTLDLLNLCQLSLADLGTVKLKDKLLKINKNFFRLLIFEKKTLYYGYAMQEGSGSFLSSDRQEDL